MQGGYAHHKGGGVICLELATAAANHCVLQTTIEMLKVIETSHAQWDLSQCLRQDPTR